YGLIANDDDWPQAVAPYDAQCCPHVYDAIGTAQGVDGNPTEPSSPNPVRYADGTLRLITTDISSGGFGQNWGHQRTWTNHGGYASIHFNGQGNTVTEWPYLLRAGPTTIIEISNGETARYFDLNEDGSYRSK